MLTTEAPRRLVVVALALCSRAQTTAEVEWSREDIFRREASWSRRVTHKRGCLSKRVGGIYLYHARKAAGTTLRGKLQVAARRAGVEVWETEGLSIDARDIALRSVVTVVSVRRPVPRVLSLYWYEHVGWWDGIKHDHSRLRGLADWVDEWRDGSEWKRQFGRDNPANVYVEIENYLTKMLTGWNRDGRARPLADDALDRAKRALDRFDVVFVCERSTWANHTALLARAVGLDPATVLRLTSKLRADAGARKRLVPKLAPDLDRVLATLERINALDLRLYDYALALDDARVRFYERERRTDLHDAATSSPCDPPPVTQLQARSGIFRPPGHKH